MGRVSVPKGKIGRKGKEVKKATSEPKRKEMGRTVPRIGPLQTGQ